MIFSTLFALMITILGTLGMALAVPAHPAVFREALLGQEEVMIIPTLLSRSNASIGKRDENIKHGWVQVKDNKDRIEMWEPAKEMWCWWLDNSKDKVKRTGTKFFINKGSICYFYEYPCNPSKGAAIFAIGNETETNFPSKEYKGFGCEKWPRSK
ncbi:hypothetical protein DM02DRAFT_689106 [Periconia macrospinosa]|uniref:Uncharacterized protein n=1 Tax=Periconia macrospinosa TaxID=97972 RepID=A0A2V1DFJ2_9PLEO|nr:hypothetical protein DM02DRAFT_689106 [Periconia macrospinosa]